MSLREHLTQRGAVCVEGVFTPSELERCSSELDSLIAAWQAGARSDTDYWACPMERDGPDLLYRIHRLETKSAWPARLADAAAFAGLLRDVFRGPATATECALTIKMPGAGVPVPWHRDPVDSASGQVFNFSIYLDDSTPENGCLYYLPGSHRDGNPAHKTMPSHAEPLLARTGDVVIHDVHVQHGSGGSRSAARRRSIVVEYTAGEQTALTRASPVFLA